jgi:hypothetical protein
MNRGATPDRDTTGMICTLATMERMARAGLDVGSTVDELQERRGRLVGEMLRDDPFLAGQVIGMLAELASKYHVPDGKLRDHWRSLRRQDAKAQNV